MTAIEIPGYLIRREIGSGGMASVYLALQTSLERDVALKVMAPALAADPAFSKRFLQEARMLASLAHPNIVQVYDVGVTQNQLNYFSMQHLPGGDFALRVRGGISEKELVRILEGVANALGYAHQRGYVHRDVAPGNILFDLNDTPVLTDFGIARAVSQAARITSAGISVGTSHYMSPEQARGGDVDARSDLYGLGVLTWFGLTGRPPYEGADGFAVSYAHVFEPIPRLPAAQAHWQPLIDKALAKDPAERYQTADEFVQALAAIQPRAPTNDAEAPTRVIRRDALAAATAARPAEAATQIGVLPTIEESRLAAGAGAGGMAAPAAGRRWLPWTIAGVGVLLVGLVLYAVVSLRSGERPAVAATTARDATVVAPPPAREPPAQPSVPVAESGGRDSVASEASTGQGEAEDAAEVLESGLGTDEAEPFDLSKVPTVVDPVVELVRSGRADLAAQRLTSPQRNNAFERFSVALRIDAKSKPARQGIVDVAQAYLGLAEKAWKDGNVPEFGGYVDKAIEVAGSIPEGAETVAAARDRRRREVEKLDAEAQAAVAKWDKAAARGAYERLLAIDAGNARAREALKGVDRIGMPGFVFRDSMGSSRGPELIVVGSGWAVARRETTKAEFAQFWRSGGERQFASKLPSCRDRESVFRSSRKRTWQAPDIVQDDTHPVVCVSFQQAQAYVDWLSRETGQRYRLPKPSEWEQLARQVPSASCTTANLADAAFNRAYDTRTGADCDDGHASTAPVGRFGAVAGVFDIDGNVREWVGSCGASGALVAGCREHGVRGRSWLSVADKENVAKADSYAEDVALNSLGFRVVRELAQ
ncbi:bifunctional serine/threonine-protein kinase/formylglycine-generating enzyme family protein [Dokdonella sp.]|uniref:bifunctional serine/threonine-protein kinase/formylglycine-generating enzyme family protein n=1 Tax=Dokdonella sp. TaxID=2291710 RepID=UPI0025C41A88|nr:bifunctional serine/threonine-protein kinase/formylglycine-generating enzyme family protein [Dokdonella sp.]MBX3692032.1 protein kinase [Dokdonella sp.]MCW5567010.1 protein kinase [Dokdonella sp.]